MFRGWVLAPQQGWEFIGGVCEVEGGKGWRIVERPLKSIGVDLLSIWGLEGRGEGVTV